MSKSNLKLALEIALQTKNIEDIAPLTKELKEAGHNVHGLEKATKQLSDAWDELNPRERAQRLRRLKEACVKVSEGHEVLADSIFKTGKEIDKTDAKVEKSISTFERMKTTVFALSAAIGITFIVSKITTFFSGATKGAAEFEQQLATVQAVSGATVAEMEKIKAKSEELGKTTSFNAVQAAEGFEILARAGLNAEQSLQTIPSVLALAKGNSLELSEAAGFITKAVQGMGLSFDDAGRVADVLAKAAASANTDVTGLGAALSYAAPSAAALGVTIEETVAYIGKFADAGIDASRAGTSLNGMFSQFGNSTSIFRRELSKIGITTNDFNQAIAQLAQAGSKGQSAINALGMEAGPALKALLSQGMGSLDELTAKLNEAGGAAQKQADIMSNTYEGAKAGLDSVWKSLKDNLGESFLDPMIGNFKQLTEMIAGLVDSGKIKQLGDSFATVFTEATTELIKYVNKLDMSAVIDKVSNSLEYLRTISVAINGAFQALSIAFNLVRSGLLAIGATLSLIVEQHINFLKIFVDSGEILGKVFGIPAQALSNLSQSLEMTSQSMKDFRGMAVEEIGHASDSIVDSLDSIAGNATESSQVAIDAISTIPKEIQKAFSEGINSAKTTEDLDNLVYGMLELQEQGKITADEMATAMNQTTAKYAELEKQTEQDIRAITKLAEESVKANDGMISKEVEHEASLLNLRTWVDELGNVYVGMAEKGEQSAQSTEQSFSKMAQTVEQKSAETKQAISSTFETLGIDLDQNLNGVNSKTQQTFDVISNGAQSVAESTYDATEKAKLLSALFEKGLNAAKTKEEFQALNDMASKYGLTTVATAEQQKELQAGMKGGTEEVKKLAEATAEQSKAVDDNSESTKRNTSSKHQQTQAIKDVEKADEQATQSQVSNASNLQTVILDVNNALRSKINVLHEMGATASQTSQAFDSIMKSQFFEGQTWNSVQDWAVDMGRLNDSIDKQVNSFENARNSAIEHTKALSSASFTSKDLAEAEHALRKATDANVQGLVRMDSQTLSNLRSAIDSTKQKMSDLASTAKDATQSMKATLASLKGNEDEVRKIHQTKELLKINEKIAEAKARNNREEIAEYERQLQLQREINKERNKQARANESSKQSSSKPNSSNQVKADSKQSNNSPSNSSSNQSNNLSSKSNSNHTIDIDVSNVADIWDSRMQKIAQDAVDELMKKLREEAKRRAN